jgi:hypothetical protein
VDGGKHVNGQPDVLGDAQHPAAWLTPGDPNFHGTRANQNISACLKCHAASGSPKVTTVVCSNCHAGSLAFTNCTLCHGGTDNASGAPPHDVAGNTATTFRGVGAHTSHLAATHNLSAPFDCTVCHGPKPTDAFTAGHIDGSVTVPFSGVGAPGSWNGTTCATYCHGATLTGGTNKTPSWTTVNNTQATCGTCHGVPPGSGHHNSPSAHQTSCTTCHTNLGSGADHVNGTISMGTGNPPGWIASTRSCNNSCHGGTTEGPW